jgi:hypothetical protein
LGRSSSRAQADHGCERFELSRGHQQHFAAPAPEGQTTPPENLSDPLSRP